MRAALIARESLLVRLVLAVQRWGSTVSRSAGPPRLSPPPAALDTRRAVQGPRSPTETAKRTALRSRSRPRSHRPASLSHCQDHGLSRALREPSHPSRTRSETVCAPRLQERAAQANAPARGGTAPRRHDEARSTRPRSRAARLLFGCRALGSDRPSRPESGWRTVLQIWITRVTDWGAFMRRSSVSSGRETSAGTPRARSPLGESPAASSRSGAVLLC